MNYIQNNWHTFLGEHVHIKYTNGIQISGRLKSINNDPDLPKLDVETNIPSEVKGKEFKTATVYAVNIKSIVQL